ncbi:DUF6082 family protein [Phytohabitans sp. ZYX-F-186]|uniref:DUF6082 family protein n=1 Tax=Phytohabitans maris TaxID=3071409 RepID=A0ABU0ZGH2_9ACTN|nr:DUF6082 family protein [Phytohabitans sp. ZYX-F-186]MDQ7906146.1 DUF6082 family protein [Phytohabitans sp. ZYX-F-186]
MSDDTDPPRRVRMRTAAAVTAAAITVTLMAALLAAGVIAVAATGAIESPEVWRRWADVGAAFGVLSSVLSGMAFVALVATLWIQYRELNLQRTELHLQRNAIERSSEELRRSADAGMRMLHFELIKMSIDDPILADVWPDPDTAGDDRRRQLLYANLVFQHMSLSMVVGGYTDEQVRELLRYLFANPIMREYWLAPASARRRIQVPGTDPWRIGRIADDVCAEYERGAGGPAS